MLALVNGGAAVALLTYLGNLVGRNPGSAGPHITLALLCYCGGLFATVVAFIFAYLVQLVLFGEERVLLEGQHPVHRKHGWLLTCAIVLVLIAALAFGLGCGFAAKAIG